MWKRLTHPNILPLLGVTIAPLQLISNWMSGGDLPEYIEKHSNADLLVLVGVSSVEFIPRLLPLPAVRRRQGPMLPPLLQRDSWGSQGSMWLIWISPHCCIDTQLAKHPCGRLWSCANCGFWSRHGHSKPGLHADPFVSPRPHRTMGCARGLK